MGKEDKVLEGVVDEWEVSGNQLGGRLYTRWFFGYQCNISESSSYLWGYVYAPRWHPIRSHALDDSFVFLVTGRWIVSVRSENVFCEVSDACQRVASTLRRMQDEWDKLSPYEREYRIW